jgi:hypothetical protein
MQELPRELSNETPFIDAFAVYEMQKSLWLQSIASDESSPMQCPGLSLINPDAFFDGSDGEVADRRKQEYFMVDRAIATPSRVIFKPAILMKSSRLTRMLAGRERIVYVKFRDEAGQPLYNQDVFKGRFHALLDRGIVDGAQGLNLQLLVSSVSQMREQTAVFLICGSEAGTGAGAGAGAETGAERVRREIIPDGLDYFKGSCPKYVSRLGQFCTGDSPLYSPPLLSLEARGIDDAVAVAMADVDVDVEAVGEGEGCGQDCSVAVPLFATTVTTVTTVTVADLTTTNGHTLLTDGAGFVSRGLLESYLPQLKDIYPDMIESATCCLQIRYQGSKGVLTVLPSSSTSADYGTGTDSSADIILRKSMVKWRNCPDDTFCVVTPNRYNRLRLNRDVLNILFSLSGEGHRGRLRRLPAGGGDAGAGAGDPGAHAHRPRHGAAQAGRTLRQDVPPRGTVQCSTVHTRSTCHLPVKPRYLSSPKYTSLHPCPPLTTPLHPSSPNIH